MPESHSTTSSLNATDTDDRLVELSDKMVALRDTFESLSANHRDAEFEAALTAYWNIFDELKDLPPTGLRGLDAKARAHQSAELQLWSDDDNENVILQHKALFDDIMALTAS